MALSVILTSGAAVAEYSSEYSMCIEDARGGAQLAVKCIKAEQKKQERRLKTAYDRIIAAESSIEVKRAVDDHYAAWKKYRDSSGAYYRAHGPAKWAMNEQDSASWDMSAMELYLKITANQVEIMEGWADMESL